MNVIDEIVINDIHFDSGTVPVVLMSGITQKNPRSCGVRVPIADARVELGCR